MNAVAPEFEKATYNKVAAKLIPFLFLCYVVAILDRVNIGFAKLQMAADLEFSDSIYGFGAGVFFIGYFLFEVPSNMILQRVGARVWIARIMITWGIISTAFMFTNSVFTFYLLRFLLGVAEAGFFPGVVLYLSYWFPGSRRGKVLALFMTAIAIANVIGAPVSGAIMQYMNGAFGWRGWQWLFLLEGIPSIIMGVLVFVLLPNSPRSARWLTRQEQDFIVERIEEDEAGKQELGRRQGFADVFKDGRVWALAIINFCGVVCFYAVSFWMPTIIQEFGVDKADFVSVGLISMIPWGAAAVAMVFWGSHSDRTGERRWHGALGLLLAIAGLLGLALFGHAAIPSIIALTFVTVGLLSWIAIFWSLPTAFLSGTAAAAGIAWINSVGNLGGHFGPDLIGRIRTATGGASEAAFYVLAGIAFLGVIISLLLRGTHVRAADANAR